MIVHQIPIVLSGLDEVSLVTCSTGDQVHAGGANNVKSSTATSGVNGRIIDRLGEIIGGGQTYYVAVVAAELASTRGSTEANRQVTLGVKLQHGDSSGGGDLADYSTGSQPDTLTYFTTARTSDYANWDGTFSTGAFRLASQPAVYDLRAAKRYIRMVVNASKNKVTTESSGDEGMRLRGTIAFMGADVQAQTGPNARNAASTSTST